MKNDAKLLFVWNFLESSQNNLWDSESDTQGSGSDYGFALFKS